VLVSPICVKLLENNPAINNIHTLKKKHYFKLISDLKREKYDLSISPHSSFRSALTAFLARIKHRIGFKRYLQQVFLTKCIKHRKGVHKIYKNLDLLKILPNNIEVENISISTNLYPTEKNYKKVDQLLRELIKVEKSTTIILAPGSVWYTKRWPLEYYLELTNKLLEKNFYIILLGSPTEKSLCDYIILNTIRKEKIKNVSGEFDLLDAAALVRKIDLVICNDSGMLHIANAMDTPVFAFFGPTTKNIGYYPFKENDFIFEINIPCRPCGSHGGDKCKKGHFNCMKLLNPDIVFQRIVNVYNANQI